MAVGRVRTEKRGRRIVAAEPGTCRRCGQPITPGERVVNEAGKFPSHRDCVRLGVALPRERTAQVSKGWGSCCHLCGQGIEKPQQWKRQGNQVAHADCPTA